MEKTTTELTQEYIKEHPFIQSCLKKGLINYSALARLIAKELDIEKKTSKEAILIAARRHREKLRKESGNERQIRELLAQSEMDIKTKVVVYITEKAADINTISDIEKKIRSGYGTFYLLDGSDHMVVITQEKYTALVEEKLKNKIIKRNKNLALVMLRSGKDVETMTGFIAYIASLFAENGVNIVEMLSCWTDTIFIIEAKDAQKAMTFLKF